MKQKYFFAQADSFVGMYPNEHCSGFANTVYAICFQSEAQREIYLKGTKYNLARKLTTSEVKKLNYDIALIDDDFNISAETVKAGKFFACKGWKMGTIYGELSNTECNCKHGCEYCCINFR